MHYFKYLQRHGQIGRRIICICFVLLMVWIEPCLSATYYVDSSNGSDTESGLTEATAYKSLSKVSNSEFLPGDSILLKRGETWNATLKLRSSGSPGSPITIGAYGTGNKPKITGVRTITSWTQVGDTGIYYTNVGRPYGVYEDGVKIIDDNRYNIPDGSNTPGNPSLTGSGGDWYYDGATSRLYYKPTSGVPGDHTVQSSSMTAGIYIVGQSYINIENIEVAYVGAGMLIVSSDHVNIDNCDISYTFEAGIQFRYSQGHCTARNNTITECGDGIYFMGDNVGPNLAANNTISYCNYVVGGSQYTNNDGHAIGLQNGDKFVVRDNIVSYTNMPAILIWVKGGRTGKDCVVKGNFVFASRKATYLKYYYGVGIGWHSTDGNALAGTRFYKNTIMTSNAGFKLFMSHNPDAKVFNNTIYDCGEGVRLKKADNWVFKNNLVAYTSDYQIYGEDSLVGTNNVFDYNLYYPDTPDGWRYRGSVLSDFSAWQNTTNQDANSIIADPLFSSAASNDFTLQSTSPAIDAGTWLTTITSPTGSGASFDVADASYFYDGYGISGEIGDIIKTESGQVATITGVADNTITVDSPISWTSGEGVALNYSGSSPDIGAHEYNLLMPPKGLLPPKGLRIS